MMPKPVPRKNIKAIFIIFTAIFFVSVAGLSLAADSGCVPRTCEYPAQACNTIPDGCGGILYCGGCANNHKCVNNQCVAGCTNECPPNSPPQCFGNAYRYCRETNNDGCLEWDRPVYCPSGWYCRDGMCVSSVMLPSSAKPVVTANKEAGAAPVISQISRPGTVTTNRVTITCATDKAAACRFDTKDKAYESMANAMSADDEKMAHFGKISLSRAGSYAIYIRCSDEFGFKNTKSEKISFTYAAASSTDAGSVISDIGPEGNIYEKEVALTVATGSLANCRYSIADLDYGAMEGYFFTGDNLVHRASVSLKNIGNHRYYVRCRDKAGSINADAAVISFNYVKYLEEEAASPVSPDASSTVIEEISEPQKEVICEDYASEGPDYVCDNKKNCICDRDCPEATYPNADPDCFNIVAEAVPTETAPVSVPVVAKEEPAEEGSGGFGVTPTMAVIAGLGVALVVALALVMKRRDDTEIEE